MPAVATQDDRRRPPPVDHEDRPVAARRVEPVQGRGEPVPTGARGCRRPAPRAGRRLRRSAAHRSAGPAARRADTRRPGPGRWSRPRAWRCRERREHRPADPGRSPRPAPGAAGSGRSCRRSRAPRRRRSARRRRAAPGPPAGSRPRHPPSPARIRRHSSARSPTPSAGVDERDPGIEVRPQAVDERHRQGDLGHEDERGPAGAGATPRSPPHTRPSCRRRSPRR